MAPFARQAVRLPHLGLMALLWLGFGGPAWSHAVLLSSEPADGSVVARPPHDVRLRFDEPVTPTVVTLVDALGRAHTGLPVRAEDASVSVGLPADLPAGTQVLNYRIVSADGHPVQGSVLFSLGAPSGSPKQGKNQPGLDGLIWLAEVGLLIGLSMGVGGAAFSAWIGPVRSARPLIFAAQALGLASAGLGLGLQGLDLLGRPVTALFRSDAWMAALQTSVAPSLAAAVFGMGLAALSMRLAGTARLVAVLALGVGSLTFVVSGHAATAPLATLARVSVFAHTLCVAFWVGALPPLLIAARQRNPDFGRLLRKFSAVAVPMVGLLILTGGTLAVLEVASPAGLVSTTYGRLLLVKLLAVSALLILAALNRWSLGRNLAGIGLRRSMAVEIGLTIVILGLVAGWRLAGPPRAAAAVRPVVITLAGPAAMADGTAVPGRIGANAIGLDLMDASMAALPAREVAVTFSLPSAGIDALPRAATLLPEGLWHVDVTLPQPGRWHLHVEALIDDFHAQPLDGDVDVPP